jgi:serine/threonine-protein kinase HSL1 (negative regulator of Swe1 kinase)
VYTRQKSRLSIVEDNLRRPSQSSRRTNSGVPPTERTEQSYDPFRSSRTHLAPEDAEFAKVTVLRTETTASRGRKSDKGSLKHPALARIRDDNSVFEFTSSPPPIPSDISILSGSTGKCIYRNKSRGSFASSQKSRGSIGVRKSRGYKRAVSFNFARTRSSSRSTRRPSGPSPLNMRQQYQRDQPSSSSAPMLTLPISEEVNPIEELELPRSKKASPAKSKKFLQSPKKPKRPASYWGDETRHVSSELEKFCDEAFNRDVEMPRSPSRRLFDSTLSVVEEVPSPTQKLLASKPTNSTVDSFIAQAFSQRKLPMPPVQKPQPEPEMDEYERDMLNHRASLFGWKDKVGGSVHLDEAIRNVDKALREHQQKKTEMAQIANSRRVVSAPEPSRLYRTGSELSPVKEEDEDFGSSVTRQQEQVAHGGFRYVSEPTRRFGILPSTPSKKDRAPHRETIRLVQGSSSDELPVVKPLNIRKLSGPPKLELPSLKTKSSQDALAAAVGNTKFNTTKPISPKEELYLQKLAASRGYEQAQMKAQLAGIKLLDDRLKKLQEAGGEAPAPRAPAAYSKESKFKNWFSRKENNYVQQIEIEKKHGVLTKQRTYSSGDPSLSDATLTSISKEGEEKPKKGVRFLEIFKKRDKEAKQRDMTLIRTSFLPQAENFLTDYTPESHEDDYDEEEEEDDSLWDLSHADSHRHGASYGLAATNWLAQILNIKPAQFVICLTYSRFRILKRLLGLLRNWRKYGVLEISYERDTARLWARVSKENVLNIPAVSIAFECWGVTTKGRRGQMSMVRMTQTGGSKKAFWVVAKKLKRELGRWEGDLVRSRALRRDMKRVLMGVETNVQKPARLVGGWWEGSGESRVWRGKGSLTGA